MESNSFIPGKELPPVVKTPVGNIGLAIVSLNVNQRGIELVKTNQNVIIISIRTDM